MKDRFEEFIRQHRDEFDEHEPPARLWNNVQAQLRPGKVRYYSAFPALAASVVLVVGSFVWFNRPAGKQENEHVVVTAPVSTEVKEAEAYYTSVIGEQSKELERYKNQYPDLYSDFKAEMSSLNNYYAALKAEYANSSNKEVIEQSIIENLQTQVQITERQLQIVQEIKNKENNRATS